MLLKKLAPLLLLASFVACDSKRSEFCEELDANREKWEGFELENYQITSRTICFCVNTAAVVIIVENGNVKEAYYELTGEYLNATELASQKTIEQRFELIEDAIAQNVDSIDVTYDETYGFPNRIAIDYSQQFADDEVTYEISAFQ